MNKIIERFIILLSPLFFTGLVLYLKKDTASLSYLPLFIPFFLGINWYYLLVRKYRDNNKTGKLLIVFSVNVVINAALIALVYFKFNNYFVKAMSVFVKLHNRTQLSLPLAVVSVLIIVSMFVLSFMLSKVLDKWLKDKTQKVFIAHQGKIAAFLSEDESVKKAFLCYEGRFLLWSVILSRPALVLWTDARIIIITESMDNRIPGHIRVLTLLSMRAIRAREAFLSPFAINIEIELLNKLRVSLWPVSQVIGEEMGEALASAVQQLKIMQGVYEGPVINHLCPFCFADAGKGRRSDICCPVCSRSLRESIFYILGSKLYLVVPILVLLSLIFSVIRPQIQGIARANNGNRILLDSDRISSFDSSGKVVRSSMLPTKISGSKLFVKQLADWGTLVGGEQFLYKWSGKKFSALWQAPDEHLIQSAEKFSGNDLLVISTFRDSWFVFLITRTGKVKLQNELSCLVDKPQKFIGVWSKELLFAMEGGGVARYLLKGRRVGWLVHPDDSGVISGGFTLNSAEVRLVDLEELSEFSLSSNRSDIVYTLDKDGVIKSQISLGEERLLPRLLCLLASSQERAVRPDFMCSGAGKDVWLLDIYNAKLIRVTENGKVFSGFCRGSMLELISRVRMWMAAVFSLWFAAVIGLFLLVVRYVLKKR